MTFYAMGIFDKAKKLGKNYIGKYIPQVEGLKVGDQLASESKLDASLNNKQKIVLSEEELMKIQLREYKKLVKLQEQILQDWVQKQKDQLTTKSLELQQLGRSLQEREQSERKEEEKIKLIEEIESGRKSLESVIEENILIKEELIKAKFK